VSELIPITINVGDRNYRIKVEPEHEEAVRKTARYIHEKVQEFKLQFAGKDMQDYVSMALIWFATQNAQQVQGQLLTQELEEGFGRLDLLLEKGIAAVESRRPE
jgi:cell division protein ZapA